LRIGGGRTSTSDVTGAFAQPPVVVAPPLLALAVPPEAAAVLTRVAPPFSALPPLPLLPS